MPTQQPLFETQSSWTPPTYLPPIDSFDLCAIDTETKDPYLKTHGCGGATGRASVVGISIYTEDGFNGYYPIAHEGGGPHFEKESIVRYFSDLLSRKSLTTVMCNAGYDLEMLRTLGIEVKGRVYCIKSTESLIDENNIDASLAGLSEKYDTTRKDEKKLVEAARNWGVDPKSEMYKLPSNYVGEYAEKDAKATYEIFIKQKKIIEKEGLLEPFVLESDILPVILDMKWNGVPFSESAARQEIEWFIKQEEEKLKNLRYVAGEEVPLFSSNKIARICRKLGIDYNETKEGHPSFTKAFLKASNHPFLILLQEARVLRGLRTKFLEKITDSFLFNGRIHANFNSVAHVDDRTGSLAGTKQRRFSVVNPPLQTIPKRSEFAYRIRRCFVADEGLRWGKYDYSQQEPRIALHYAYKLKLVGSKEARARYIVDRDTDFYSMMKELAGIDRNLAKEQTLANLYMQTMKGYASTYGIPIEETRERFQKLNSAMPWLKEVGIRAQQFAQQHGYVRTISGAKRRFPLWIKKEAWRHYEETGHYLTPLPLGRANEKWGNDIERADTRKALNGAVQGSGGDMVKQYLVTLHKEKKIVPYITVHDEVDCPIESDKQAEEVKEIGESVFKSRLTIPMKIDMDLGKHWV